MRDSQYDPYSTDLLNLVEGLKQQSRDRIRGMLWLGTATILGIAVGTLILMTSLVLWS